MVVELVDDRNAPTLDDFLFRHLLLQSANILHTDGWLAYFGINWQRLGYYWMRNIHDGAPKRN